MGRVAAFLIASLAFTVPAQADCNAKAEAKWKAGGKFSLTVHALTTGKTCDTAVALLIVRNDKDAPLYTFVAATENVAMLAKDHRSGGQTMAQALAEWIGLESNTRKSDFLQPWAKDANQPPVKEGEEFPFTVSDEISRDAYEVARKASQPLYCFVTGMESETCLTAPSADTVIEIGIQSFPG